ncbi:MAG: hypothetical protein NC548_64870 [Lachnospiraceae bacterium]|nr:hypothetical protein [Lachnospiraceae bacterium]
MKVALVQTKQNALYGFHRPDAYIGAERAAELQEQMLKQCFHMIREAAGQGCDLIVTTEAINFCGLESALRIPCERMVPPYPSAKLFSDLADLAKRAHSWLVAGVYRKRRGRDGKLHCYNSALIYDREGQIRETYDKIHLTETEADWLTPGDRIVTVDTDMGRMGVAVCYDMQFTDVCGGCRDAGAEFMAVPTWGWEHGYGMKRIRETGLGMAVAMAVPWWMPVEGERSPSELIHGSGKIIVSAGREKEELLIGELAVHSV